LVDLDPSDPVDREEIIDSESLGKVEMLKPREASHAIFTHVRSAYSAC
jgi:hypothetical protein